jgi:hypothetical protein
LLLAWKNVIVHADGNHLESAPVLGSVRQKVLMRLCHRDLAHFSESSRENQQYADLINMDVNRGHYGEFG